MLQQPEVPQTRERMRAAKSSGGTSGPSTPTPKANGTSRTPGTCRGRKRKNATTEDGGSTAKHTKNAAADMAEEEPEENESQNETKAEEEVDSDQAVD
jgi:hypothetical protein